MISFRWIFEVLSVSCILVVYSINLVAGDFQIDSSPKPTGLCSVNHYRPGDYKDPDKWIRYHSIKDLCVYPRLGEKVSMELVHRNGRRAEYDVKFERVTRDLGGNLIEEYGVYFPGEEAGRGRLWIKTRPGGGDQSMLAHTPDDFVYLGIQVR